MTDFAKLRNDFPILAECEQGKPLIYLDSAASAQKPKAVLEAINQFYQHDYANIHRGIYELSARATRYYEEARLTVQRFINAKHPEEIVFVSGTTGAINLVAQSFGRQHFKAGDEIILSGMEHHSNIVPWYLLKQELGIELKVIPVLDDGALDLVAFDALFSPRTKLVALSHVSNALGTINPIAPMISTAHMHNVPVLIDGAQAVPHIPVDVSALDADFYVFSGHKLYGPTGIGVLYAKKMYLDAMPPYQGGGDMIETVAFDRVTFAKAPQRFEAGTPHIAGVIGLAAAIRYVEKIGMQAIADHEQTLLMQAETALSAMAGLRIIGTAKPKVGVISFVIAGIHPHDIGTVLDHEGVAVRAGHHCAMPLMERFNVPATVRASFGIYNNEADIAVLIRGIQSAQRMFA